jgi:cell division septation protein DedD
MIEFYIKEWLLKNGSVIVPEFGGFYLEEVGSRYDGETFQFIPAGRQIRFDENDRFLFSMFYQEVFAQKGEEIESLQYSVEKILEQLRNDITETGKYKLQGIGEFYTDDLFRLFFRSEVIDSENLFLELPIINREESDQSNIWSENEVLAAYPETEDDVIDEEVEEILQEYNLNFVDSSTNQESDSTTDNPFAHWKYVNTNLDELITENNNLLQSEVISEGAVEIELVIKEDVNSTTLIISDESSLQDSDNAPENNEEIIEEIEVIADSEESDLEDGELRVIEQDGSIEIIDVAEEEAQIEDINEEQSEFDSEIQAEEESIKQPDLEAIKQEFHDDTISSHEESDIISKENPELNEPYSIEKTIQEQPRKLSIPVLLILILIPIVAGIGVFVYLNYMNKSTEQVSITEKVSDIPTVSGMPDDAENDNIITNESTTTAYPAKTEEIAEPKSEEKKEKVAKKVEVKEQIEVRKAEKKVVEPTPTKEQPVLKEKVQSSSPDGQYHLAVGSFGVEGNATRLAETLKGKGYDVIVFPPKEGKKLYRVAIGSFSTSAEAKAYLAKEQGNFPDKLFIMK